MNKIACQGPRNPVEFEGPENYRDELAKTKTLSLSENNSYNFGDFNDLSTI